MTQIATLFPREVVRHVQPGARGALAVVALLIILGITVRRTQIIYS